MLGEGCERASNPMFPTCPRRARALNGEPEVRPLGERGESDGGDSTEAEQRTTAKAAARCARPRPCTGEHVHGRRGRRAVPPSSVVRRRLITIADATSKALLQARPTTTSTIATSSSVGGRVFTQVHTESSSGTALVISTRYCSPPAGVTTFTLPPRQQQT